MTPDQIRTALDAAFTVDITTTGRRSGLARRIEIWMIKVDGDYYITGTPGARDWYANLQADPTLTLHLKDGLEMDLPAVAIPVIDPDRRGQIFTAPSAEWYRSQAEVEDLVAGSPLVKLAFRDLGNGSDGVSGSQEPAP